MKVLFLGGTSYLGKEIIKRLEARGGYEITVIHRDTPLAGIEPQDVVFNLVADYGKGNKPLSEVISANVLYTTSALEKIQFKTIINFSTALGKNVSNYSFSKKVLEEALIFLTSQNKWQLINLQLQHFFGPGAPDHNFVKFLIDKMLKNEELFLTDCLQKRDFIFVPDLVNAVELILNNLNEFSPNETIEIGSGESLALKDFVEIVKNVSSSYSKINYGALPRRANEPAELVADITKIKMLGWAIETDLKTALCKTIDSEKNSNFKIVRKL